MLFNTVSLCMVAQVVVVVYDWMKITMDLISNLSIFFSLNLITTINLFIDEASEMMDLNF